jgi:hypothetical protein
MQCEGLAQTIDEPGGYERFLAARDGTPDLLRHTLSRREALFQSLAEPPIESAYRPDRAQFLTNFRRSRPEAGLDRRLLWLLATAKSNQAERFAVGLAELFGRMQVGDDERVLLHIHLQETYHTRILADVVALFGLPVPVRPPARFVRALIYGLVFAPPRWHLPLTGASEMAGCVIFRALRDRGVELFAGEPEVVGRMRTLFDEILGDEVAHVGYIASKLGPGGRKLMRRLYANFSPRLVRQMAELDLLYTRAEWSRRLAGFDIDEFIADCPDTAYAAARI